MNKLLLAGVALVLVVVVGTWLVLPDSPRSPADTGAPAAQPTQRPEGTTEPDTLSAETLDEPRASAPATQAKSRRVETRKPEASFEIDGAKWLDVALTTPPGYPAEEDAALVALIANGGNRDTFRYWLQRVTVGGDAPGELRRMGVAWSQTPLAASMRIPLPSDASQLVLVLRSRYLHAEPRFVQLEIEPGPIALEPALGGFVSGECVLPAGAEARLNADGVGVAIAPFSGDTPLTAFSIWGPDSGQRVGLHEDHTFELRAIPAGEPHTLYGQAANVVSPPPQELELGPGEHRHVRLEFRLGAVVRGKVVAASDGAPIEGASVFARNLGVGRMLSSPAQASSGADGTFELFGVVEGGNQIVARRDGWLDPDPHTLEVLGEETIEGLVFELDAGDTISGSVAWSDGVPAAGATLRAVKIHPQGWVEEVSEAHADENGVFTLQGLEDGPLRVLASAELDPQVAARLGESWVPVAGADPHAPSADTRRDRATWNAIEHDVEVGSDVFLTLGPPLEIRGRVLDDTGTPLEGFTVEATPDIAQLWHTDSSADSFATEDGSFVLEVPYADLWRVQVSSPLHYSAGDHPRVEVPQTGAPLEVVLTRTGTVVGVVHDPAGQPVPGAVVHLENASAGTDAGEATCGPDGRFQIPGLPGERPTLVARHDDWARSAPRTVELEPGAPPAELVLTLRVGARITGEVLDAEGQPEEGRNVTCGEDPTIGFGGGGNNTRTDVNGYFEFDRIAPGKVIVACVPSQEQLMERVVEGNDEASMINAMGQMRMETVEVGDGEHVHVVLGARPKRPVHVSGRVTEDGEPLAQTGVFAFAEGSAIMQGLKAAQTKADGRFDVVLDRPGDYVFGVSPSSLSGPEISFFVTVPEVAEWGLDLRIPEGSISGRVLGPDGEAAAGAPIRVERTGGARNIDDLAANTLHTGEDGTFEFSRLRAGTYELAAGGPVALFGLPQKTKFGSAVVTGIELEHGKRVEDVLLHLGEPGTVAGVVRDAAGRPLANAAVFARDAAGNTLATITPCMSDAGGTFEYPGLPPGRASVFARTAEASSSKAVVVEVVPGETAEVELTLDAGGWLVISFLRDGEPARANLRVLDDRGHRVSGLLSATDMERLLAEGLSSKERRVGPLPPGEYTAIATTADGASATRKVTLRPGEEERELELRLD